MTVKDTEKRLEELKAKADKQFGQDSILLLGDDEPPVTDIIPTGIYSLDRALGIGGLPKGRMVEIYGPESGGKTTLALYIVAEAQRRGDIVAYIDAEYSLDLNLAKNLGVKTEELLISQPDGGEDALEKVEYLARSGEVGVIVVDSVAALTPKAEQEGKMGDSNMGVHARLMSQACRKLVSVVSKTNTLLIFINQIRMKIGVMFGSPETTTGGNALKFYCSQRLEVRKGETIKEKDEVIGHSMVVKVTKNKMAKPFIRTEFPLYYGKGFDLAGDIFDLAVQKEVIEKAGAHYKFEGKEVGHGRNASIEVLSKDEALLIKIVGKLDELTKTLSDV
jgi:recombination protein RecA